MDNVREIFENFKDMNEKVLEEKLAHLKETGTVCAVIEVVEELCKIILHETKTPPELKRFKEKQPLMAEELNAIIENIEILKEKCLTKKQKVLLKSKIKFISKK
jgi:hypothetical protein